MMEIQNKVGIYLRLSNEDNDKEESESIKNQRNLLVDYIKKESNFVLIDEYCDEDLSGAGTYRPEFERLIKDCEIGRINIVLCKSQSRFSRDMEIVERYLNNKFKEWKVRFIGVSDNADTNNQGNKKARQINGLVNEWYLEDVSANIRSALNAKMKQGEFISPFAAYGYRISKENNNKLLVDPVASNIVKEIYTLYLSGRGFTTIANDLNTKKIPSPSLYKWQSGSKLNIVSKQKRDQIKWNANMIKRILTNELYCGHLIQGKRTTVSYKNHHIINKPRTEWIRVEKTHKAIIDSETFKKVQQSIKLKKRPCIKTGMIQLWAGKAFCLECHSKMKKKSSMKHDYLVCSNTQQHYSKCPNTNAVRYEMIEQVILEELNKIITKYFNEELLKKYLTDYFKQNLKKENDELDKQKLELIKRLKKNEICLKKLYEDKIAGLLTGAQFKFLSKEYNTEQDHYKEMISKIAKKKKKEKKIKELNINNYKKFKHLNRIIIDEFIDKIYIGEVKKETNTRNIQIKWNFE